jgi:hypothetical protein
LRIAEVDVDVGFHGEALVIGEFFAAVPGQRFVKFVRQLSRLLDQGGDYSLRILGRDLGEHQITRVAFDKRQDVAVIRPAKQVALPVTRHGPVLNRRWSLSD